MIPYNVAVNESGFGALIECSYATFELSSDLLSNHATDITNMVREHAYVLLRNDSLHQVEDSRPKLRIGKNMINLTNVRSGSRNTGWHYDLKGDIIMLHAPISDHEYTEVTGIGHYCDVNDKYKSALLDISRQLADCLKFNPADVGTLSLDTDVKFSESDEQSLKKIATATFNLAQLDQITEEQKKEVYQYGPWFALAFKQKHELVAPFWYNLDVKSEQRIYFHYWEPGDTIFFDNKGDYVHGRFQVPDKARQPNVLHRAFFPFA